VCPTKGVGCCLGPDGNGVSPGEGGKVGPGPPDKERDKQSRRKEAAWSRRKKERRAGVMTRTQRAHREHC
jgi:hypothetical protein